MIQVLTIQLKRCVDVTVVAAMLCWALLIGELFWNFLVGNSPYHDKVSFVKGDFSCNWSQRSLYTCKSSLKLYVFEVNILNILCFMDKHKFRSTCIQKYFRSQNNNQICAPKWKFYSKSFMPNQILFRIIFLTEDPTFGTK